MPAQSAPDDLSDVKSATIQEELKIITSVPSNKHLFKRTPNKDKPILRWLNTFMDRVIANEKAIAKCMSTIKDNHMTKEMLAFREEHKQQMDQIRGLNIGKLSKRLNGMEKNMLDYCTVTEQKEDIDDVMNILNEVEKSMVIFCFIVCSCIYVQYYMFLKGKRQDCQMGMPGIRKKYTLYMLDH